jgi:hypothetical protein
MPVKGRTRNRHQDFVRKRFLESKEIKMSSPRHGSWKRVPIIIGLSAALILIGSCSSSDPIGALGAGGQVGPDAPAAQADVPISTDTQGLVALCRTTGGQLGSAMCCLSVTDYPDTCAVGACGCSPTASHEVVTCDCSTGSCFSRTAGCVPRSVGGTGGNVGSGGAGGTGTGGQRGPDAAADAYQCPPITDVYCPYGYAFDSHGCAVCALAPSDAAGTGGRTGTDAGKLDAPITTDATSLAELCLSTGGQLASQQACLAISEFPNTCVEAACSPANSHAVTGCACPVNDCFSPPSGCVPLAIGGTGGRIGSGGASGSGGGGGGGSTGAKSDALASSDATPLADLCLSTGGQVKSQLCCGSVSDYPNSCVPGPCGCAPENSHTISVCDCPGTTCFTPTLGCTPTAGADASPAGDAGRCTAQPGLDASCIGTVPPHYFACVGSPPSASCVLVAIGDMTDGYCCP